jgi:DDE superfamily endonuclease
MLVSPISVYPTGNISLQMQVSQPVPPYLFHIVDHDTILLNGVVHSYGMNATFMLYYYSLTKFCSPATREELFNLRHAMARNVIERAFGVIKQHFKILIIPPEYSMDIQARVFPALAAIHNYILEKDPIEIADMLPPSDDDVIDRIEDSGRLATEYPRQAEKEDANARRDQIAENMWNDYQRVLRER